jgi:hypothetical protein
MVHLWLALNSELGRLFLTSSSAYGATIKYVEPGTYDFTFPPYAFGPLDNAATRLWVHMFHGMDGAFGGFQTLSQGVSYTDHTVSATMYPVNEPGLYTFFIMYSDLE